MLWRAFGISLILHTLILMKAGTTEPVLKAFESRKAALQLSFVPHAVSRIEHAEDSRTGNDNQNAERHSPLPPIFAKKDRYIGVTGGAAKHTRPSKFHDLPDISTLNPASETELRVNLARSMRRYLQYPEQFRNVNDEAKVVVTLAYYALQHQFHAELDVSSGIVEIDQLALEATLEAAKTISLPSDISTLGGFRLKIPVIFISGQ